MQNNYAKVADSQFRTLIRALFLSDIWKVSITTGVYEPEDEEINEDAAEDGQEDEQEDDSVERQENGQADVGEDGEAGDQEDEVEDDQQDDSENTNNNADDELEGKKTDKNKARKSAKYRVPPKPPTCGLLVVLYGERGKTPILSLKSSAPKGSNSFQPGCADDFKVFYLSCST
jgi:hypothetical protein